MSALLLTLVAVINIAVFKWQELSVLAICILAATTALAALDPLVRQTRISSRSGLLLYAASVLLVLIPFAAATWLALILLAVQISRAPGASLRSHAAMICLAWLGMTELGMLLMTKFKFSLSPLLSLDAELVRLSLLPFVDTVVREDNLLIVGDYSGVILWGCTGVRSACLLVIAYRLALLAGLEAGSAHPIAQAIARLAVREGIVPTGFAQPSEQVAGAGVSAQDGEYRYRLGHARFACGSDAETGESALTLYLTRQRLDLSSAQAVDSAATDADILARITLEDQLRPEAAPVIEALRERGLVTWLMSGDQSAVPQQVATALGIDHCQGGMTPQDKQQAIEKLQADGAVVVMVGDGVNDAPGLGQAHLGIAMGSGTDLAQTTADAVLLGDRLPALVPAFRMAERTAGIIKQNLRWAVGYNLAILPPAALGFVPPWLAALGMSLSSLVVVINALRLRQRQQLLSIETAAWKSFTCSFRSA